ncbi:DivIVA domain-containing protein [Nocardioides montaniterrae]
MSDPMMWVFAIIVVLAMGVIAMLAAGYGEPMRPAYDDRPDALVPADRPLAAGDLRTVRFSLALRGYRMSEVDALLRRLADEMSRPSPEQVAGETKGEMCAGTRIGDNGSAPDVESGADVSAAATEGVPHGGDEASDR